MLILPGTLEFQMAIENLPLPPDFNYWAEKTNGNFSLTAIPGTGGILRCVPHKEAEEFVFDGEYQYEQDLYNATYFTWVDSSESDDCETFLL